MRFIEGCGTLVSGRLSEEDGGDDVAAEEIDVGEIGSTIGVYATGLMVVVIELAG